MTISLPLHTARLVLRPLQPHDLERFAAYRADAELARYQGWSPMSLEQARAFIATAWEPVPPPAGHWRQLAIARRDDDGLLGDIGLCLHGNGDAEIGFTLARDAQGRGFATEALQRLCEALSGQPEVACIVALTDARNTASIRVLERLGLSLVSRHDAVFKQEPCVELRYERPSQQRGPR